MKRKSQSLSKSSATKRQSQAHPSLWLIWGGAAIALAAVGWLIASLAASSDSTSEAISRLSTGDFHSLAFSPADPDTVFFGHHGGLMVSRNGGQDWQPASLRNADAMALAIPVADPQTMYAAGHDVFFKSTDGGQSWQAVAHNLPGTDIHGFAVDPGNAEKLYAHVAGFVGIFASDDGGNVWTALPAAMPAGTFNLAVGETAQMIYAAAGNAGLWRTTDGGQTWMQLAGVPGEGVVAFAYNSAAKRLFISTMGNNAGLYASSDGGITWNSLGLKGTLMAVASSPADPNRLIAVDDKGWVYASRDGGITWSDKQ